MAFSGLKKQVGFFKNTIPVALYIQVVYLYIWWLQKQPALQHSESRYPGVYECELTGSTQFRWRSALPLTSKSLGKKETWGFRKEVKYLGREMH